MAPSGRGLLPESECALLGRWQLPVYRMDYCTYANLREGVLVLETWNTAKNGVSSDMHFVAVSSGHDDDWCGHNFYDECSLGYIEFLNMEYLHDRYFEIAQSSLNALDRRRSARLCMNLLDLDGIHVQVCDRVIRAHLDRGFCELLIAYRHFEESSCRFVTWLPEMTESVYVMRSALKQFVATASRDFEKLELGCAARSPDEPPLE